MFGLVGAALGVWLAGFLPVSARKNILLQPLPGKKMKAIAVSYLIKPGRLENPGQLNSEKLISALRSGSREALEGLYMSYRDDFFRWAGRRFQAPRQDFEDAWQEAVFAFYEQVAARKLTALRHSARTWLFAVGYRRLLNYRRKTKRIFWKDEIDDALVKDPAFQSFPEEEPQAEEKESLMAAMQEMPPQCGELLKQRFFLEKSIAEMQGALGYQSVNALSVSLSRCLKRLKEIITDKQGRRLLRSQNL